MLCSVRLQVPTRVVGQDKPLCAVNQSFFQASFKDLTISHMPRPGRVVPSDGNTRVVALNSMDNSEWRAVIRSPIVGGWLCCIDGD
jgi:hypothetical protein